MDHLKDFPCQHGIYHSGTTAIHECDGCCVQICMHGILHCVHSLPWQPPDAPPCDGCCCNADGKFGIKDEFISEHLRNTIKVIS